MNSVNLLQINIGLLIAGGLLAVAFLLMYIAFGKKSRRHE